MLHWTLLLLAIRCSFAAVTIGNLTVLSYNVAGLPGKLRKILREYHMIRTEYLFPELLSSGNPATNTPLISSRLKPYNIINVQEDFNYHAALYASDTHVYRTSTSGGAGIGSGLNTLSDYPFIDFERTTWANCNLNGGDCLTPKGFTFMRVRVSEGVWVDVYNLHTDAGSDAGDISARGKNFAQVSGYIAKWSAGMPVIVMGDTNARYTRPGDAETLASFISGNGFTDAWIVNARGGSVPASGSAALVCDFPFAAGTTQGQMVACEVVDKIFIRASPSLTFTASTFVNANNAFVDSVGAPLSDHYPIMSTLTWRLSSSIRMGDPVGGPHGNPFNDIPALLSGAIPKLSSITIRGGNRVDGISYTVQHSSGSTTTTSHGGSGGTAYTIALVANERVVETYACSGKYNDTTRVFYLRLTTNLGRTLAAGKTTSDCVAVGVPSDAGMSGAWGLVAFWGRDGNEVDRVAPIWGAVY
ncbi:hypothetical protein M413DRAFT_15009 [Hebeloma cylindrosporum]|uniref:Jacalin-type lectin domain-containing protein n=1 Tax=Hebeloma cylindrosporum TaxID=76867 RepID=A0A0C3CWV0_HEBCY|nr:hypothetical protein M413DRAFT_15009 [Hebeloma cylindrosporum h7]